MFVVLAGEVAITQHNVLGRRAADRHPRSRLVHGRARPALGPPVAGRRARAKRGRGARHSVAQAARRAGRRGRARRAHHARADPAPRRPHRERRRGPGDRRPRRATATCCGWRDSSRATAIRTRRSIPTPTRARGRCSSASTSSRRELPIVLCPNGQMLRNPSESELARCIGLVAPDRPDQGLRRRDRRRRPGRARGGRLRRVRGPLGARARLPRVRRPGGRVGAHRELSRLSDRHHRHGAHGARLQPGAEVRRRDGDPGRGRAPAVRLD